MQEKATPFSATKAKNAKNTSPANFTNLLAFLAKFEKCLRRVCCV
jgi:hypothetical protein